MMAELKLKVGQKVNIYQDPLTQKDLEGRATLIDFSSLGGIYEGRQVSRWLVAFDKEPGGRYYRSICPKD